MEIIDVEFDENSKIHLEPIYINTNVVGEVYGF